MKEKKKYVKPRIDILNCQFGESVMITVSGSTTPEESQACGMTTGVVTPGATGNVIYGMIRTN